MKKSECIVETMMILNGTKRSTKKECLKKSVVARYASPTNQLEGYTIGGTTARMSTHEEEDKKEEYVGDLDLPIRKVSPLCKKRLMERRFGPRSSHDNNSRRCSTPDRMTFPIPSFDVDSEEDDDDFADTEESEMEDEQEKHVEARKVTEVSASFVPACFPSSTHPSESFLRLDTDVPMSCSARLFDDLIGTSCDGMKGGMQPVLIEGCTGGAYYLRSLSRRITTVFKPTDEEPYGINNPKEHVGLLGELKGIKRGIPNGSAAIRECAAYVIDQRQQAIGLGADVPKTTMAIACHPKFNVNSNVSNMLPLTQKVGSLQAYVHHDGSAEDLGSSKFSLQAVHRIAMLDIRLCNQDRHGGNILLKYPITGQRPRARSVPIETYTSPSCPVSPTSVSDLFKPSNGDVALIPIDHGCCLPTYQAMDETTFIWLSWKQSHTPFTSPEIKSIELLNSYDDAAQLQLELGEHATLGEDAILTLHIGTLLLKLGASIGLTLYDIGSFMVRDCFDEPSELEQVIDETHTTIANHDSSQSASSNSLVVDTASFMNTFETILTARLLSVAHECFHPVLRRHSVV